MKVEAVGGREGGRTLTVLPPQDFKSCLSANSITRPYRICISTSS